MACFRSRTKISQVDYGNLYPFTSSHCCFFYTVHYCDFSVLLQHTQQIQFLPFYSCLHLDAQSRREAVCRQAASSEGPQPCMVTFLHTWMKVKDKCQQRVLCNYTQTVSSQVNTPLCSDNRQQEQIETHLETGVSASAVGLNDI